MTIGFPVIQAKPGHTFRNEEKYGQFALTNPREIDWLETDVPCPLCLGLLMEPEPDVALKQPGRTVAYDPCLDAILMDPLPSGMRVLACVSCRVTFYSPRSEPA